MRCVARWLRSLFVRPTVLPIHRPLSARAHPACVALESRDLPNAAFDLIGLTALRRDPVFAGLDGSGINVAVIDTGLDRTHPLLGPGYVTGFDFLNNTTNQIDLSGHGTQVAGLIAARNTEIGVAPGAGLIGLKVGGATGGPDISTSAVDAALRWVYANRQQYGILVVDLAFGSGFFTTTSGLSDDPLMGDIQRLEQVGITVVGAAGNSYKLGGQVRNSAAPGVYSTLDVGAVWQDGTTSNDQWPGGEVDFTTGADRMVSFTQRPATTNVLFAPGAILQSTLPGGGLGSDAGTSVSAPIVAGATAIVEQAAQKFLGRYLAPAEVRQLLQSTADTVFDGDDEDFNVAPTMASYPRLNLYNAIRSLVGQLTQPPPGTDPNGYQSGAVTVPPVSGGQSYTLPGEIGPDGDVPVGPKDVDLYKFEVREAGTVTITVGPSDRQVQTWLRLFDANGHELSAGGNHTSTLVADLSPGTYFVGVSGNPNINYDTVLTSLRVPGSTGAYTITIALATPDPDGLPPGAHPIPIQGPTPIAGVIGTDSSMDPHGTIEGNVLVGTADVDLYQMTAPDVGTLTVAVTGALSPAVRVWAEAAGGALTELPIIGQPGGVWQVAVTSGMTLLLGLSDAANASYDPNSLAGRSDVGSGGPYSFTVGFANNDSDGTIPTATELTLPTVDLASQLGFRDVNFYHVQSSAGGLLEVSIIALGRAGLNGAAATAIAIWDAQGHRLASADSAAGSDPDLFFPLAAGTDYYVSVSGLGNESFDPFQQASGSQGAAGSYFLTARVWPFNQANLLNDGSIAFGVPHLLGVGDGVNGNLGTDGALWIGAGDVDLYRIQSPGNLNLAAWARPNGPVGADVVLRLFDSNGHELASSDHFGDTAGGYLEFAALKGQVFYLGISGNGPGARDYDPRTGAGEVAGATGAYTLSLASQTDASLFAGRLELDLAGHPADAATIALFEQSLGAGRQALLAKIATDFVGSDEAIGDQIAATYSRLLGRPASDAEIGFWLGQFHQGLTLEGLTAAFVSSDEYFAYAGGSDSSWLDRVYTDLLGRSPDAAAQQTLADLLAGRTTRAQVTAGILSSSEYSGRVVSQIYLSTLKRAATALDVSFWAPFVTQNGSAALRVILLSCDEAAITCGGGSLAGWVSNVYRNVLGRPAEPAGEAFYLNFLLNSLAPARHDLAASVIASTSTQTRQVAQLYQTLLGRSGSTDEIAFWVGRMQAGQSYEQVVAGFQESPEYADKTGGTDASWLRRVYVDLLGRPLGSGEGQGWLDALASGRLSRFSVSLAIQASLEAQERLVGSWFTQYLGRSATGDDLAAWVPALQQGQSAAQLLADFLAGSEYFLRTRPT